MLDHVTSWLATLARFGHARAPGAALGSRPAEPLILYEYEPCPMCRRVREALTDLALDVRVRPCPKEGTRFRPEAAARAGRARFPFLVDPNTGVEMTESEAIVAYLYERYGDGAVPAWLRGRRFRLTAILATFLRGAAGLRSERSRAPAHELRVRAVESDPWGRLVRERLSALEVAYVREPGALWLRDPESGADLTDGRAIVEYLNRRYAL